MQGKYAILVRSERLLWRARVPHVHSHHAMERQVFEFTVAVEAAIKATFVRRFLVPNVINY
jgi:hypothetical protein